VNSRKKLGRKECPHRNVLPILARQKSANSLEGKHFRKTEKKKKKTIKGEKAGKSHEIRIAANNRKSKEFMRRRADANL